jgi:hypothetical protein
MHLTLEAELIGDSAEVERVSNVFEQLIFL